MLDPPRSRQWFVSDRGELSGPFDSARVENLIRWGRVSDAAHVCDDAGSAWLPIRRSVFAALVPEAAVPVTVPAMAPAGGGIFTLTLVFAALVAAVLQG
jgi:hypothetical protein